MKRLMIAATGLLVCASTVTAEPMRFGFNVAGYAPGELASTYARTALPDLTLSFETNKQLTWDQPDGFGVTGPGSYSYDEIEGDDRLVLRFSRPVHLLGFDVTDFFHEREPDNLTVCPALGCYREWGAYQISYADGTTDLFRVFTAPEGNTRLGNGDLDVLLDHADVVSVLFAAPGRVPADFLQLHELSLAGVTIDIPTSVPEPGTLLLLGVGLLALTRRRG